MPQLSDTRVLVTGGTSGLGRAMAQALALAGARVALTSRHRERAQATAADLGADQVGIELDVRDATSVAAAVDSAYAKLGGLDMLVNNAGIGMRTVNPRFMTESQPFWEVTPAGFRNVLETKATGTFLVARAVVSRMLSDGGGRVVTISMSEQTMTRRGFIPYGPSGAAVEALARVMAADLADTPVTANILLPGGATATGMVPDEKSDELRPNPTRRSWGRRSCGWPRPMPPESTTNGSSHATSRSGWSAGTRADASAHHAVATVMAPDMVSFSSNRTENMPHRGATLQRMYMKRMRLSAVAPSSGRRA